MLLTAVMALAAVQAAEVEEPEPWKDEKVCAWRPGMKAIEMVPARTRRLWKRTSFRVEGRVTVDGAELPYESYYKESQNQPWYKQWNLEFRGTTYEKASVPRILSATDVVPIGDRDGVPISVEPGARAKKTPEVIYLLERGLTCEFQPYQIRK